MYLGMSSMLPYLRAILWLTCTLQDFKLGDFELVLGVGMQ